MPKKVFSGLIFALSGNLSKSHKELGEIIEKNGGEVTTSVSQRVTHLISTKEDVKLNTVKVKRAEEEEIPVVTEEFIHDSIENGEIEEEEDYNLRPLVHKTPKKNQTKDEDYNDDDDDEDGLFRHNSEDFVEDDDEDTKKPVKRKAKSPGGSATPTAKKPKTEAKTKTEKTTTVKKEPKKPKEKKQIMPATEFLSKAKPFEIKIATTGRLNDVLEIEAVPKQFSTGSFGWGCAGKIFKTTIAKQEVNAQLSINLIVRGSKQKLAAKIENGKTKETPKKGNNQEPDGEWEAEEEGEEVDDEIDDELEEEEPDSLSDLSIPLDTSVNEDSGSLGLNNGKDQIERSQSLEQNSQHSSHGLADPLGTNDPDEPGEAEKQWSCQVQ